MRERRRIIGSFPWTWRIVEHFRDIPATAISDMPDRIIAATAKATKTRLVTRDESIGKAAGVEVVW
ncbi:MAG: PIN domain-containing protein [Armatimonadetes bacterium]|nr:PIN domain-containing protein [Armatimonadota bacterium]